MASFVEDEEICYEPAIEVAAIVSQFEYKENVRNAPLGERRRRTERETDEKRLSGRQKQIEYGKNTIGYERYLAKVPITERKRGDPKTPDKHQVCSKRSWDGQISKWRRQLHHYD